MEYEPRLGFEGPGLKLFLLKKVRAVSEAVHTYSLWMYRLWESLGSSSGSLLVTAARSPRETGY